MVDFPRMTRTREVHASLAAPERGRFFELPVESTGGRRRRLLAQFCENTKHLASWPIHPSFLVSSWENKMMQIPVFPKQASSWGLFSAVVG